MGDSTDDKDDGIIELNEEGNIHVADRSLGIMYRGSITGSDENTKQPTIHLHSPPTSKKQGAATIRIIDADAAAAILEDARKDVTALDNATDAAVAVPYRQAHCTVCHEQINKKAICIYRTPIINRPCDAVDELTGLDDHERGVWCHIGCANDLAETLQNVWNHSDKFLINRL